MEVLWVQSLVGELKSHILQGVAKKKIVLCQHESAMWRCSLPLKIWYFGSILQQLPSVKCLSYSGGSFQRAGAEGAGSHAFSQGSQPRQDEHGGPYRGRQVLHLPQDSKWVYAPV